MSAYYISLFIRDDEGRYSIFFPDFPEVASCGDNLDDAMDMARDALRIVVESYVKEGRELPNPVGMAEVKEWEKELRGAESPTTDDTLYPIFPCPDVDSTPVKVTLSMTIGVLKALDRKAHEHGMTRSGYIAQYALA